MRLSKTELQMLEQVAKGKSSIKEIATALKKSNAQIYRSSQNLRDSDFVTLSRGMIEPAKTTHSRLILQLLSRFPNIINPLADSGIGFFTATCEPKTIKELTEATGLKRTRAFWKLKQAKTMSLISIRNGGYSLNDAIWPQAKEFLMELKNHEETTDRRIPSDAIVYHRTDEEIVFSSKTAQDAVLTGFSAYGKYGIELLSQFHDYCLPKKKLTKRDVFMHSLYHAEKEEDARNIAYIALFYLKHRKSLAGIKSIILENINKVLHGQKIPNYPTLAEIKEKAEVYDIKI